MCPGVVTVAVGLARVGALKLDRKGAEMAGKLEKDEVETLRKGAMGAGLLVSVSDRGFFDSFKEAGTLAKHVAAARGSSASEVVREVAEGHGVGFGVTTPPDQLESETLDALRSSVQLLQSKAPEDLDAYRVFVH